MSRILRQGWHTAFVQLDDRDPAEAAELSVNAELDRIQADAYGAGFLTDVRSVTVSGVPAEQAGRSRIYAIILYRLDQDPSFRPPM